MQSITARLDQYIKTHPVDLSDDENEAVLNQLYQAYAESHESDPVEISEGFRDLKDCLCGVPLDDNNAVFKLCCWLCTAYERKAFLDGLQYGAHLMRELGIM